MMRPRRYPGWMGSMAEAPKPCCGPSRSAGGATATLERLPVDERPASDADGHHSPAMVALEGGSFLMGTDDPDGFPDYGEGPVREVELSAFGIETVAVSNQRFREFIDDTGHVTDAERYGWSFVFGGLLPDEFPDTS